MSIISLDMYQATAVAALVFVIGKILVDRIALLRRYCIPAPVVGGLLYALIHLAVRSAGILEVEADMTLKNVFMVAFFCSVGYTASFKMLKKGGIQTIVFLALAVVMVILQNVLGAGLATVFDLDPRLGLATGSIPMVGGNGTAAAWGPVLENAGLEAGTTIATAAATFGLVAGALLGGPVGRYLIEHNNLKPSQDTNAIMFGDAEEKAEVTEKRMTSAAYQVLLTVGIGTLISWALEKTGVEFPASVGAMTAAAILRNIADHNEKLDLKLPELAMISNISLLVFLALSMMTMKLWQLIDLALPMIVILLAQMVLMAIFGIFVTFRFMGKNFDAAVMTVGQTGFGLGAVPTAMANMQVIDAKYGSSPTAFFIVPLVGSLFINLVNSGLITVFLNIV